MLAYKPGSSGILLFLSFFLFSSYPLAAALLPAGEHAEDSLETRQAAAIIAG
jgi:hypothetical protein